jgi:hypothetical protein
MIYVVQPGDTPMVIAQKLTGNAGRMGELVRANAHKSSVSARVGLGQIPTFRELHVGEHLTVPPAWESRASLTRPSRQTGVAGHAYPQPAPAYAVRPRAGADGGGDDSGHGVEPILTIMGHRGVPAAQRVGEGVGQSRTGKPCCNSCASGGSCEACEGAKCAVQMPPCSAPKAQPSIPGSTSFPVGFGQAATATTTASTIGDALSGWGVPLAVGAISIAAGFGLAYVITNR